MRRTTAAIALLVGCLIVTNGLWLRYEFSRYHAAQILANRLMYASKALQTTENVLLRGNGKVFNRDDIIAALRSAGKEVPAMTDTAQPIVAGGMKFSFDSSEKLIKVETVRVPAAWQ